VGFAGELGIMDRIDFDDSNFLITEEGFDGLGMLVSHPRLKMSFNFI
jgi:hypothetical protein